MSINPEFPTDTNVMDPNIQTEALSDFRKRLDNNEAPTLTEVLVAGVAGVAVSTNIFLPGVGVGTTQNIAQIPNGEAGKGYKTEAHSPRQNDLNVRGPINRVARQNKTYESKSKGNLGTVVTEDVLLNTYLGASYLNVFTDEPINTGIFRDEYEFMLSATCGGVWVRQLDDGRYSIKRVNIQRRAQHTYNPYSEDLDLTSGMIGLKIVSVINNDGEEVLILSTQSAISTPGEEAGISANTTWLSLDGITFEPLEQ